MDKITKQHFDKLYLEKHKREEAVLALRELTAHPVSWVYEIWDALLVMLRDGSRQDIAIELLADLARSDSEGRILRDLDELMMISYSRKLASVRQVLHALSRVATARPEFMKPLLKELEVRYSRAPDHPRTSFVRTSVIQALKHIFIATGYIYITKMAERLIELEPNRIQQNRYHREWERYVYQVK